MFSEFCININSLIFLLAPQDKILFLTWELRFCSRSIQGYLKSKNSWNQTQYLEINQKIVLA